MQPASDVAKNLERFLVSSVQVRGNNLEFIPTVKIETIHPVDGSCGSEFPAICNHCGVMAKNVKNAP